MRAFRVTGTSEGGVADVAPPVAGRAEVVVATARAGICGTDAGLFAGGPERIAAARTNYPVQLGHEWCGLIVATGDGVDPGLLGQRVTGDTMIGCGVCHRCRSGRHHVCDDRVEIGVRGGWPGAFSERFPVPAVALHPLPDAVDDGMGAMVEPGGNALRAVDAAMADGARDILIVGAGTIGLLAAQFARARGATALVLARRAESTEFAAAIDVQATVDREAAVSQGWPAVIDCTDSADMPALALDWVEPTGRVVLMGVSRSPSVLDTRVALRKEATIVGILGASAALEDVIGMYAAGLVDPRPLIAETIGLDDIEGELAGRRPRTDPRPKVLVDPAR